MIHWLTSVVHLVAASNASSLGNVSMPPTINLDSLPSMDLLFGIGDEGIVPSTRVLPKLNIRGSFSKDI